MRIVGVVASRAGGSTDALVRAVLDGASEHDSSVEAEVLHLGHEYRAEDGAHGLQDIAPFDAVVLGTPMYRATHAGVLKAFLDDVPRGKPAEDYASPLRGVPLAVVATGASAHHFLGVDPLVALLVRFFAAWIVPPAVYGVAGALDEARPAATELGEATALLSAAQVADPRLAARRPQF